MYKVINIPAYTYHVLYLVHVGEQVSWTELGMIVYTYIIQALRRPMEEDHKIQANLGYIVNPHPKKPNKGKLTCPMSHTL